VNGGLGDTSGADREDDRRLGSCRPIPMNPSWFPAFLIPNPDAPLTAARSKTAGKRWRVKAQTVAVYFLPLIFHHPDLARSELDGKNWMVKDGVSDYTPIPEPC